MSLIKVHIPAKVAAADATDAPINDVKMAIASTGAKVISVRSDQPNWFTFTIEGKSVRSVSQIIDKVSRVARVRKNSPEMWNPVTDPKNFKLQLAFDAANDSAAQDAGAFPLAEKASRIVKGIMSQVKRVEDEAEAAFRNAKTAEEKNAAQRDAVAIHNIMDKLEIAASYA